MHEGGCVRRYGGGILCCRNVICIPIKDDTVAEKLSQELKGKQATVFAKYTCVEMASRKIQKYQNKAKNLYTVYFLFDLDIECKFIKTKHYSD